LEKKNLQETPPDGHIPIRELKGVPGDELDFLATRCGMTHARFNFIIKFHMLHLLSAVNKCRKNINYLKSSFSCISFSSLGFGPDFFILFDQKYK
jgi:hypothetical protein